LNIAPPARPRVLLAHDHISLLEWVSRLRVGFQALEQFSRDSPETKVVFLTMHRDGEFGAAAIDAGARSHPETSRGAREIN
jgi:DNA-binding NarL/FixJ family response regulator